MKSKENIKSLRIQIIIDQKVIKVQGQYKFKKIVKVLKKILPSNWHEFTLETCNDLNWDEKTIVYSDIRRWWYYYRPHELFYSSPLTLTATNNLESSAIYATNATAPLTTTTTTFDSSNIDTTLEPNTNIINIEL